MSETSADHDHNGVVVLVGSAMAFAAGVDTEARGNMMLAATQAGIAFSNSDLTKP